MPDCSEHLDEMDPKVRNAEGRWSFPLNPRIDYIFVSPRIAVDQARVPPRSAGDHFPVRAALKKGA